MSEISKNKKPNWLKIKIPGGERYRRVKAALSCGGLHTVCEEARCPNMGECWEAGTATFMILGDVCTRGCAFCAVTRGDPGGLESQNEPSRLTDGVKRMGLDYAVITSVTRDDLPDGGASVFAECVRSLKRTNPDLLVELLIPDYLNDSLCAVLDSKPDVLAHNIEVVQRLSPSLRHPKFSYLQSLKVLEQAKTKGHKSLLTKSSIMLGLGETDEDIEASMKDLRRVDVDILVLGQYLQPTRKHAPVTEYVHPEQFEELAIRGRQLGFGFVAAGPLVRTSYKAAEAFARHHLKSADE